MEVVGRETIGDEQADNGDSWTVEVTLDLPGIALEGTADLTVEMFGIDPPFGKSFEILLPINSC